MIIKKSEILKAVEKASISVKDSYIVSITDRKNGESNYASVCASDGNAQSIVTFMVDKVDKPVSFITGPELLGVLKALGEFGDEYSLKVEETSVSITVGSAAAPVLLKKEGTSFPINMPKEDDDSCIYATVVKDDYVKAVKQGSFAYGGKGCIDSVVNTVAINPVKGDKNKFNFLSTDGRLVVRSEVEASQSSKTFGKEEDLHVSVDATAMRNILSRLDSENILLFIFEKQILIKDGNDFYAIMRYETKFPGAVGKLLDVTEYNYKATFDASMLKASLDVATIHEKDKDKQIAVLDIQNGNVIVSSVLGYNKAMANADNVEGEVNIHINPNHLKMVIDNTGTKNIMLYGSGDLKPIYMKTDGAFSGLMGPVAKDKNQEAQEQAK